jgi:hypothetical protein
VKKIALFILFLVLTFELSVISYAATAFTDGTATYGIADGTTSHVSSAWIDIDDDGDLDLYSVNVGANNKLFRNNGPNTTMTDVTATYGVADGTTNHYSSSWVDVDNDGDLDLYSVNVAANNKLFRNNGANTTMTDVTATYGVADGTTTHYSSSWVDVDNDGDLDLYSVNYGANNKLFRNNGPNTTMTDVTATYGVADGTTKHASSSWIDIDKDGDLDLYFVNYQANNKLYRNNGPNTTMTDVTATYGVADGTTKHYSSAWIDIDNDGDLDLYSVNYGANNKLFRNNGPNTTMTDVTATYGVADGTTAHLTSAWIDIDNDGDLDLYSVNVGVGNKLYQNNGANTTFTDVTAAYGVSDGVLPSYTSSWIDIDNDGDLDMYSSKWGVNNNLYLNPGQGNSWLKVEVNNSSERYQYNSRIEVDLDGNNDFSTGGGNYLMQYQSNSSYGGNTQVFSAQDPVGVFFGLGSDTSCKYDVRVFLPGVDPSGDPSLSYTNVCPNQTLTTYATGSLLDDNTVTSSDDANLSVNPRNKRASGKSQRDVSERRVELYIDGGSGDIEYMMVSRHHDFDNVDWREYKEHIEFELAKKVGTQHIYYKFKDALGNESPTYVQQIKYEPEEETSNIQFTKIGTIDYTSQYTNYFYTEGYVLFSGVGEGKITIDGTEYETSSSEGTWTHPSVLDLGTHRVLVGDTSITLTIDPTRESFPEHLR